MKLLLPPSPDELAKRLQSLHKERSELQQKRKQEKQKRRHSLNAGERGKVLEKTGSHCHLCGGQVGEITEGELEEERKFVVDHIVPWASGGDDSLDNFLPAHGLCNGSERD